MDVTTVAMPEQEAEEAYKGYLEAVKTRKEEYLEDLKKVYHALKQGKKVIDIFEAFKQTGINKDGDPNLAISLAGEKQVSFYKETGGAGWFSDRTSSWGTPTERVIDVRLPNGTFPEWERTKETRPEIIRRHLVTNVPVIPAHLLPNGKLNSYYLLWEVDEWMEVAKAKDPFLLKRINANTFVVLAAWDLTEVEQIVMRGR